MPNVDSLSASPRPEDLLHARLARLLLLLAEAPGKPHAKPLDLDRIGTYDFFADNPLLVFEPESGERRRLLLSGFEAQSLSYHSSSQRFSNRRARMQHDLAHLLARGLVTASAAGSRVVYALTDLGENTAEALRSSYADSYRASAALTVRRLNRLSDRDLRQQAARWVRAEPFLLDLYGADAAAGEAPS